MHQISSALRGCSNSLKVTKLECNPMGGERLVEIIDALSVHPQLEKLQLPSMNIGRNECAAIASLLSHTATELHTLDLRNNSIDDEGVDILVGALTNSNLRILDLAWNQTITARGYRGIAILLENPSSNLAELHFSLFWKIESAVWCSFASSVTALGTKGHSFSQMHWPATAN